MHSILGVELSWLHAQLAHAVEERALYIRFLQITGHDCWPKRVSVTDDHDVLVSVHHRDHLLWFRYQRRLVDNDRVEFSFFQSLVSADGACRDDNLVAVQLVHLQGRVQVLDSFIDVGVPFNFMSVIHQSKHSLVYIISDEESAMIFFHLAFVVGLALTLKLL